MFRHLVDLLHKNRMLKSVLRRMRRILLKADSRKMKKWKQFCKKPKIKVVFLVQNFTLWSKLSDIYDIMKASNMIEAVLLVLPDSDPRTHYLKSNADPYEMNPLLQKYPEAIKAMDEKGKYLDPKKLNADYFFYQRPYDGLLPRNYRSCKVIKYAKTLYLPYGYDFSSSLSGMIDGNRFFNGLYMGFFQEGPSIQILHKNYLNTSYENIHKFYMTGYPEFEPFIDMQNKKKEGLPTIVWTPRWSCDENIGGSHFMEYKDMFLRLLEKHSSNRFIFRPHPLLFGEMELTGKFSEKEKKEFLGKLSNAGAFYDTGIPLIDTFTKADIMITDVSSVIMHFFMTGKPIILCPPQTFKIDGPMADILDSFYIAKSENEIEEHLDNILRGNDYLQDKRREYFDKYFSNYKGAAEKIVDLIVADGVE